MQRYLSFVDERAGVELVLPVTPEGYAWTRSTAFSSVHIDQLGEVSFPAGKKANSVALECLLPANPYPFLSPGAVTDPRHYLDQLELWRKRYTVLRYIVSGTDINEPVQIQDLKQTEEDGTNDVTATITLREYLAPGGSVSGLDTVYRVSGSALTAAVTYVVQRGDTLSGLARRFYGDASLCWRLAAANNIANANLIYVGQVLTIPAVGDLPQAGQKTASARAAEVVKGSVGQLTLTRTDWRKAVVSVAHE